MRINRPCISFLLLFLCGCSHQNWRVETKFNGEAAITGLQSLKHLQGAVITSWIDRKAATMSTLYGNDLAVQYTRTHSEHNYPAGSVLSLATWRQQEDPRWFGGKIPAQPQSVEIIVLASSPDHGILYKYQKLQGTPLREAGVEEGPMPNPRSVYLLSQRAAVMP
jgi:hypothetical protein